MKGETQELWMSLCAQAAVEQDPVQLLELVKRINELLEEKEKRLNEKRHTIAENQLFSSWPCPAVLGYIVGRSGRRKRAP